MSSPDLMLCSRADVISIGFANDDAEAIRLTRSDPNAWDGSLLDLPITFASADVDEAAGNRFSLGYNADVTTYPFPIRSKAALRAVYYCWLTYCRGQAMPPEVKAKLDASDAQLALLRQGKQGVGSTKVPGRRIAGVDPVRLWGPARMSLESWRLV